PAARQLPVSLPPISGVPVRGERGFIRPLPRRQLFIFRSTLFFESLAGAVQHRSLTGRENYQNFSPCQRFRYFFLKPLS
ncbi:MAG: hypothetical protein U0326_43930, partial [Polyangiales bacterium]